MLSDGSYILMVTVMAAAAFLTRIAGSVFMAWVALTPKSERFLEGLSVSVIAALVASLLMSGDVKTGVATLLALIAMALFRSVVWAMLAGMICAAAYSFVFSL
ncbi:AzlD domain-containing protein [uncultured Roseibium sp.]|uniref:AzlD domain-containing protein n=1 Tax=uncultured Roseibium sp. TaxID=1936171 RepID=UPI002635D0E1|nr:AzlD domain-containing protein [uncultured Roseibium sp.]